MEETQTEEQFLPNLRELYKVSNLLINNTTGNLSTSESLSLMGFSRLNLRNKLAYFPVVLFIMLYKVLLTFESVDEILKCDHSHVVLFIMLYKEKRGFKI